MRIKPFLHEGGEYYAPRPMVQIGQRFYTIRRATEKAMEILDAAAASKEAFEARYGDMKPEKTPVECGNCGYQWSSTGTPGQKTRCSQCQKSVYIPKEREAGE